ncbi:MAG: hypothetical protein C0501_13335 [Isosphaera sp.]|nr:hypothetical protein [Isosphaera sp.]
MSADPKNVVPKEKAAEPNALLAWLSGVWTKFKQGQLVSYKVMAVLLIVGAAIGVWWYIASSSRKAASQLWVQFEEAADIRRLEDLANDKNNQGTPVARVSALLVARARLGPEGMDRLASDRPELRQAAEENVEKAREAFGKLLGEFKDDPVFKAECLLGLAKAEAALIGIKKPAPPPAPPAAGAGPVAPPKDEYKGSVPRLIEYLDQLSAAAAPDTPWATDSKKLADELRKNPTRFEGVQRALTGYQGPVFPTPPAGGPLAPTGPFGP